MKVENGVAAFDGLRLAPKSEEEGRLQPGTYILKIVDSTGGFVCQLPLNISSDEEAKGKGGKGGKKK